MSLASLFMFSIVFLAASSISLYITFPPFLLRGLTCAVVILSVLTTARDSFFCFGPASSIPYIDYDVIQEPVW
ncbi:hypothetical protein RSAG8_06506, partial [Rhizoctonia solani AG-8 WAC10335]